MGAVNSTLVAGSSNVDDVINFINNVLLADYNGNLDTNNLAPTLALDVSDVSDAADTKGFHLTGNITCDAGVTVDGQDVSELKNSIVTLENNYATSTITTEKMVIASGTIASGESVLAKLQAVDSGVSTSTHDIYYTVGLQKATASDLGSTGTGIRRIDISVSNYVVSVTIEDENGDVLSDGTDSVRGSYMAIAIKK